MKKLSFETKILLEQIAVAVIGVAIFIALLWSSVRAQERQTAQYVKEREGVSEEYPAPDLVSYEHAHRVLVEMAEWDGRSRDDCYYVVDRLNNIVYIAMRHYEAKGGMTLSLSVAYGEDGTPVRPEQIGLCVPPVK